MQINSTSTSTPQVSPSSAIEPVDSEQMSDYIKILDGPRGNPPVREIAELINTILQKSGHRIKVSPEKLSGGPKAVWEHSDGPLYNLMIEDLFPTIVGEVEVYHFAPRKAAQGILESSPPKLRLTSMTKRVSSGGYSEGELTDFLEKFGFPNFTSATNNLDQMAGSKFYTSFAKANLNVSDEQKLWDSFAKKDGARFKFRIGAAAPYHFKEIKYDLDGSSAEIFREINESIRLRHGYQINFNSWSTFIGFYLGRYMYENECRILLDTQQIPSAIPIKPNAPEYPYFEVEIGSACANPKIELLEVVSDEPNLPIISGVTYRRRNET